VEEISVIPAFEGETEQLSEAQRAELLHLAARRSMVFRDIVRHAVQDLRSTIANECPETAQSTSGERTSRTTFGESRFRILSCLVEDGPLTVSQIAESCRVSVPAISRMLNHLEETGLVERRVDATNRRVIRVYATDDGRAARANMIQRFGLALERVLSPLSNAELTDLITAFGHLERLMIGEQSGTQSTN
jgi:DNA-binding MarR family transcriptional regulator